MTAPKTQNLRVEIGKEEEKNPPKDISVIRFGRKAMTRYGKYVIEDRALPDFRDGLKPVHRKILWAMYDMSLNPGSQRKKSARLIGEVIGKWHPHGDQAAYQALVTVSGCASGNNISVPLADGEGNWFTGIMDDSAASMRYCFTEDTRVQTSIGLLTFGDLAKRFGVYKKANKEKALNNIYVAGRYSDNMQARSIVCSGIQPILKVTAESGISVKCTPNEPFLVITPKGFKWKTADTLVPTDWLCVKRGSNNTDLKFSLKDYSTAVVLGYLVGDGYVNRSQNHVGFNQVNDEVFKDFLDAWANSHFGKYPISTSVRQPSSFGKQKYNQFYCNSVEAVEELGKYGLYRGDSYDRCVPSWVWKQHKAVVAGFLSSLFESDGSVFSPNGNKHSSSSLYYCSVSETLLFDLKVLLQTTFGVSTSPILMDKNANRILISGFTNVSTFMSEISFRSIQKTGAVRLDGSQERGDVIPYADVLKFNRGDYSNTVRSVFRRKVEAGELKSKAALDIYDADYVYSRVVNVEHVGNDYVYDLTVPNGNSFTANGFIVHNTNTRMSKFSQQNFFNPDYVAVIDKVPNYDDTEMEPVILPSLIPHLLVNGTFGIGVAVTSIIPAYSIESLKKVVTALLEGKDLKARHYAKMLQFNYPMGGGECISNEDALSEFYENNAGRVQFKSLYHWNETARKMTFYSFAPGLNVSNIQALLLGRKEGRGKSAPWLKHVADALDETNKKDGPIFSVVFKKNSSKSEIENVVQRVAELFTTNMNYKINVTERLIKDGVEDVIFHATTIPKLMDRWIKWRVELELRMLNYKLGVNAKNQKHTNLLILACANIKTIMKALEQDEPEKFLVKELKISEQEANTILDLKVRNLSKLDNKKLVEKLNGLKSEEKDLQAHQKNPNAKIIDDLKAWKI